MQRSGSSTHILPAHHPRINVGALLSGIDFPPILLKLDVWYKRALCAPQIPLSHVVVQTFFTSTNTHNTHIHTQEVKLKHFWFD